MNRKIESDNLNYLEFRLSVKSKHFHHFTILKESRIIICIENGSRVFESIEDKQWNINVYIYIAIIELKIVVISWHLCRWAHILIRYVIGKTDLMKYIRAALALIDLHS